MHMLPHSFQRTDAPGDKDLGNPFDMAADNSQSVKSQSVNQDDGDGRLPSHSKSAQQMPHEIEGILQLMGKADMERNDNRL